MFSVPEELEGTDNTSKAQTPDIPSRNAYSSPKEHIERLVESFDGEKSPWEESQMSLTKTTKTPRKMMKHDIHPMSQSCSTVEAVSSNQEFEKNIFQSKNKTSILSLDVGKLPKETHGNTMTLTAAIEHEPSNANSSSHIDLEKNLFGPAVSEAEARGTHHSAAEAEVDGGVFGEKLHDNNGKDRFGMFLFNKVRAFVMSWYWKTYNVQKHFVQLPWFQIIRIIELWLLEYATFHIFQSLRWT